MKSLRVIAIILLSCIFYMSSSCSDTKYESRLDRLEAIVDSFPDSVIIALNKLQPDSTIPEFSRARHALLHSWAIYKTYGVQDNDSIISIAIKYYSGHQRTKEDQKNLAKAYFLLGIIHAEQGMNQEAMKDFLNAEDALSHVYDPFLLGFIYQSISELFSNIYAISESLDYAGQSLDAFRQYGDSSYIANQEYFIGQIHFFSGDYKNSTLHAKKSIEFATHHKDTTLLTNTMILLIISEYAEGKVKEGYADYMALESLPHRQLQDSEAALIGNLCQIAGDTARASHLMNNATENNIILTPTESLVNQGKYQEAYEASAAAVDSMDHVLCEIMNQNISAIIKDYRENKKTQAELRELSTRHIAIVIISALVMITFLIIIISRKIILLHRQKERSLGIEKENQVLKVEKLTNEISKLTKALNESSNENNNDFSPSLFIAIMGNSFRHLDEISKTYHESLLKNSSTDSVSAEIKKIIDGFDLGGANLRSLENIINDFTQGGITELRAMKSNLADTDFQLLLLSIASLSSSSISFIMKIEVGALYSRKKRLKERIRKLNPDLAKRLLSLMK